MADIIFRYDEMQAAATKIEELATSYKNAATKFETEFTAAIAGWEGDSKVKMEKFIAGTVKSYTEETVPGMLSALAELLKANAKQMAEADTQIADNIPG